MLGWVHYEEAEKCGAERVMLGSASVLILGVPRGESRRCALLARRAARFFARCGVRLAALPTDYPYAAAFSRRGIAQSDTSALYRACAAEIARCALCQCGISPQTASVALLSQKPSAALQNAAHALCPCVRYLTLCVPNGEELARELRWRYGIAVRLVHEGEELSTALALSFDGAPAASCPCIPLADGRLSVSLQAQIGGKECADSALLAALYAADALKTDDICVEQVIFPPIPNFA